MTGAVRKAIWLELFYDLIFVVAIAKAVHSLSHAHNGEISAVTYLEYGLIMVPLWWAWTGHTLFANRYDTDDAVQRTLTLAQMAVAAMLAVFIDLDFDANYHGFLISYVVIRGLLVLMYCRAAILTQQASARAARYLGRAFTVGALISLSSLAFDGLLKYGVLYLGIAIDIAMPLLGRRHLARAPVESHHMPERYALLTIILLGESVASTVSSLESVGLNPSSLVAAVAGFVILAAIWWVYYDNLEDRIYGRMLGTGQAVIYLHLLLLLCLGGVANIIHFAIAPELSVAAYKRLVGMSLLSLLIVLQLLFQVYHDRGERRVMRRNTAVAVGLCIGALVMANSALTLMTMIAAVFVVYTLMDVSRRRALAP